VSNEGASWLIVHRSIEDCIPKVLPRSREGLITLVNLPPNQIDGAATLIPDHYETYVVMDKFRIALPREDCRLRQETLDGFFHWLGRDYERSIDVARNLENLSVLVSLLRLPPPAVIADFGCGSGLAHMALPKLGYTVLGIDSCATMRDLSRARGMTTFSPEEFAIEGAMVDGVISSYVLHFGPEQHSLSHCWSRLRKGGIFAANVHKGQGLDRVLKQFAHINGQVRFVGSQAGMERHGIYVQIEKV
jgi:SAM-dependent methyltransferase